MKFSEELDLDDFIVNVSTEEENTWLGKRRLTFSKQAEEWLKHAQFTLKQIGDDAEKLEAFFDQIDEECTIENIFADGWSDDLKDQAVAEWLSLSLESRRQLLRSALKYVRDELRSRLTNTDKEVLKSYAVAVNDVSDGNQLIADFLYPMVTTILDRVTGSEEWMRGDPNDVIAQLMGWRWSTGRGFHGWKGLHRRGRHHQVTRRELKRPIRKA